MIATVTKKFVTTDNDVTLMESMEVVLDPYPAKWYDEDAHYYHGSVYNGPFEANVKFTRQQAADWLVFRRAHDLGYRKDDQ